MVLISCNIYYKLQLIDVNKKTSINRSPKW